MAYVGDFLLAGSHENQEFLELRDKIRNPYWWGEWGKGTFVTCGVRIVQRTGYSFTLDQDKYEHEVLTLVDAPKGPERNATESEVSPLRGALGALQWKASQAGPQISAKLHALQSQLTKATEKMLRSKQPHSGGERIT
mgnify:CR=1 FL=1